MIQFLFEEYVSDAGWFVSEIHQLPKLYIGE